VCVGDRSACSGGFFAERRLRKRVLLDIAAKLLPDCERVGRNGHVRRPLSGRHGLDNACDCRRRKRVSSRRACSDGSQCISAGWIQRCAVGRPRSAAVRQLAKWQSIHRESTAFAAKCPGSAFGRSSRLATRRLLPSAGEPPVSVTVFAFQG
jgi:hypothetical protein